MGRFATVLLSEVIDIHECFIDILTNNLCNNLIYICSDSQSALKSLSNYRLSSSLVLECRDTLQLLSTNCSVTLTWVAGHVDISQQVTIKQTTWPDQLRTFPSRAWTRCLPLSFKIWLQWRKISYTNHWRLSDFARQARNCVSINKKYTKFFLSLNKINIKRLTDVLTTALLTSIYM